MGKTLKKIPPAYRKRVKSRLDEVAGLIRLHRNLLGMTQEDLAEELDVSPMTIQFIEQGRRFPSVQMLFYVCDYLKIELSFGMK